MLALLLFVLSSSSLFLVFRGMSKGRDPLPVLMCNYLFCSIFSFADYGLSAGSDALFPQAGTWMPYAAVLGFLFLINFSITEKTVRQSGAAISSVATKLSLVLPFFYTLFLKEQLPGLRSASGLLLCMASIVLISLKPDASEKKGGSRLYPLLIFLGTGFTDVVTQWLNQALVPPGQAPFMVFVVFSAAFVSALLLFAFRCRRGESNLKSSDFRTGFLLGLPNFISYKSILAALSAFHHQGNVVFPLANLGVILFTTLVSILYFRDKPGRWNIIGIFLALLALWCFFQPE